jgi:hypothetical protein
MSSLPVVPAWVRSGLQKCSAFGMVGVGTIYEDYADGRLIDDEAVALVHAPQELGWLPLSVPWVDYQPTIDALSRQGLLLSGEYKKLLLAGRGFISLSAPTRKPSSVAPSSMRPVQGKSCD